MTTDNVSEPQDYRLSLDGPALADELARLKRVKPIESAEDLACDGIFDTDDELHEFLEYTYAARRADQRNSPDGTDHPRYRRRLTQLQARTTTFAAPPGSSAACPTSSSPLSVN